jgi:hypothetical protein
MWILDKEQHESRAAGKEMQQCVEGELIIYDANTFKEIRREPHKFCEGKGWIQH